MSNVVNFAHNFRSRLLNGNPEQERVKQEKLSEYRRELQLQIQQEKKKKIMQKKEQEEYQIKLQMKINQDKKIQAQKKNVKQEPSYFVVRSSKGQREKNNSKQISPDNTNKTPIKIQKRGGYHNQSSLDPKFQKKIVQKTNLVSPIPGNFNLFERQEKNNFKPLEQYDNHSRIVNEDNQRITRLLIIQQEIMRKMDSFKTQIKATVNHLNVDKQIQRIRKAMRSKNLFENSNHQTNSKVNKYQINQSNGQQLKQSFYYLPPVKSKWSNPQYFTNKNKFKRSKNNDKNINEQNAQFSGHSRSFPLRSTRGQKKVIHLSNAEQRNNNINIRQSLQNSSNYGSYKKQQQPLVINNKQKFHPRQQFIPQKNNEQIIQQRQNSNHQIKKYNESNQYQNQSLHQQIDNQKIQQRSIIQSKVIQENNIQIKNAVEQNSQQQYLQARI